MCETASVPPLGSGQLGVETIALPVYSLSIEDGEECKFFPRLQRSWLERDIAILLLSAIAQGLEGKY
jgi:hypothetical protein